MKRRLLLITLLIFAAGVFYVHREIHEYDSQIVSNINDLDTRNWPRPRVAVVFGASVYGNRVLSPVLKDRVTTAIELYRAKKVDKILVSGDNRHPSYNEPRAMAEYLAGHGVQSSDIVVDPSGRSTYETCMRAKEVFGLRQVVLVSQQFHLPRALYIANQLGLAAEGVAGNLNPDQQIDYQFFREWGAELKAYFNLNFFPPEVLLDKKMPIT